MQYIFGFLLISLAFIETFLIIARHIFGYMLMSYYEIVSISSCFIMLIGLNLCSIANEHISVDFFNIFKQNKYQAKLKQINYILFFFTFTILFFGVMTGWFKKFLDNTTTMAYDIPLHYYYLIMMFFLSFYPSHLIKKFYKYKFN